MNDTKPNFWEILWVTLGSIGIIIVGFISFVIAFIVGIVLQLIEYTWKIFVFAIAIYLIYLLFHHWGVI